MAAINPLIPTSSNLTNSYHPMLQESTRHFLTQLKSGIPDFSNFTLLFSRLIQTMPSPPIEIVWFYTAVNYHTHKNMSKSVDQSSGDILCLEELFNSLVSSSGSCSSSANRIAVLAPLIYELHSLIELKMVIYDDVGVVSKEIRCLVDRLVCYISLCCFGGVDYHDESPAFSPCFADLIKVWTFGRRGESESWEFEDDFRMFFPLVSGKGQNEIWLRGEVGALAGFVMCEVFMLNLCFKFCVKERPHNVEGDLMLSAVDTITGFKSCYFFDALLNMLLESSLPVASLLTAADGIVLQEAIYDAIVCVDYPFFNPASGIGLCNSHLNSLASTWLFVADRAIQFVRDNDGEDKVISYMKAFTKSLVHSQLMRWVSAEFVIVEDANIPKFSTPAAFLGWLIQLRGIDSHTFGDDFSLFLDKAICYKTGMTSNRPFSEPNGMPGSRLDHKVGLGDGIHTDLEMTDSCKSEFSSGEALLRKRKGEKHEDNIQAKLPKYHIEGSPALKYSPYQAQIGVARRI